MLWLLAAACFATVARCSGLTYTLVVSKGMLTLGRSGSEVVDAFHAKKGYMLVLVEVQKLESIKNMINTPTKTFLWEDSPKLITSLENAYKRVGIRLGSTAHVGNIKTGLWLLEDPGMATDFGRLINTLQKQAGETKVILMLTQCPLADLMRRVKKAAARKARAKQDANLSGVGGAGGSGTAVGSGFKPALSTAAFVLQHLLFAVMFLSAGGFLTL